MRVFSDARAWPRGAARLLDRQQPDSPGEPYDGAELEQLLGAVVEQIGGERGPQREVDHERTGARVDLERPLQARQVEPDGLVKAEELVERQPGGAGGE